MPARDTKRWLLHDRTRAFALRVIKLFGALPKQDGAAQVIGKQLLRSGTSVGAQYREAMRARSRAEFASKVESSLQELEEARYWLELLVDADLIPLKRLEPLINEADELTAMLVASARTTRQAGNNRSHE